MIYTIDIAFKEPSGFELDKNYIKNIADQFGCFHYYITHEYNITKGKRNTEISCIMTLLFYEDNLNGMISFIKAIKNTKDVYIESIYTDKILYASLKYKKTLIKRNLTKFNYSDNEQIIIALMIK